MATRRYPGFGKSEGAKDGLRLYRDGDYVADMLSAKLTPDSEATPQYYDKWEFKTVLKDGPEQEDGKVPAGQPFTHFVTILLEGHPSFEEWGHIGIDELKSITMACGISTKGDNIPSPDDFGGQTVKFHLRTKTETIKKGPKAGQEVTKNIPSRWKAFKE